MMLIYNDREFEPSEAMLGEYLALNQELREKNKWAGGNRLESVDAATSVRVRDGRVTTTDGPFAETRELLGGYYILDCEDLDEAIAYAARIPAARSGTIEIRPITRMTEA